MKKTGFFFVFILLLGQTVLGQISPPGLGKANFSSFMAIGLNLTLDSSKTWQSVTYFGMARKSNPDNYNPLYKPALLIFNQEFYHQFHKSWQYSFALSYRRQDNYLDNFPYEYDSPFIKQEFRTYGRIIYSFKTARIKIAPIFRQEFRTFFTPDFLSDSEVLQFRSRIRLQFVVYLDAAKVHRLSLNSEQLFSISKRSSPNSWTDFNYRESRFNIYYSFAPKKLPFILSVGYMNNLVGNKNLYSVHCFGVDIIIKNPFGVKKTKG